VILYYLSFCDVKRPEGEQFLGATIVVADNPAAAHLTATLNGVNPGGEIALVRMEVGSLDDLPARGRSYVNRFVPREEVMAYVSEPSDENEDEDGDEDMRETTVCQDCNPIDEQ
jgi:hypothetical protein